MVSLSDLHYYKVHFEIENFQYRWYEDITASNKLMDIPFSGIIKLVPIEYSEALSLGGILKANGFPEITATTESSRYVYNKWQEFTCSFARSDFLLCDTRMKIERMTWQTALYLAVHLFNKIPCKKEQDMFLSLRATGKPYFDIKDYSVLPSGEVTLYVSGGLKENYTKWEDTKVYFIEKKSRAKNGFVSKFIEEFYLSACQVTLSNIEYYAEYLKTHDRASDFIYGQRYCEVDDSSDSNNSSSSSNCEYDMYGCKYIYIYETAKDEWKSQPFGFYVTGKGMSQFMDYGQGTDTSLIYPYISESSISSLTEGLDIHYVLYNKYEKYKEPYDLYVYYCNNEYENTNSSSSNSGDGSSSNNGNEQEYYDSSNSSSSSGNEYISDVGILISANEIRNKDITGWHVLDNWPYSTWAYVTPKE